MKSNWWSRKQSFRFQLWLCRKWSSEESQAERKYSDGLALALWLFFSFSFCLRLWQSGLTGIGENGNVLILLTLLTTPIFTRLYAVPLWLQLKLCRFWKPAFTKLRNSYCASWENLFSTCTIIIIIVDHFLNSHNLCGKCI